jgi:uncharacterized protein
VKLDLSLIDDEPLRFDEKLELAPDRLDEDQVAGGVSVHLEGSVRSLGSGFIAEGVVEATGELLCSRCLTAVPWRMEDRFSSEYRPGSEAPGEGEFPIEDDELDVAFLQGTELNLVDLAAEQVLLALPMWIVCDDNCAGLCPSCGANRNVEGACRCEPKTDPRWDALKDAISSSGTN